MCPTCYPIGGREKIKKFSIARRIRSGEYQIGIYIPRRIGRSVWQAVATVPGTTGEPI